MPQLLRLRRAAHAQQHMHRATQEALSQHLQLEHKALAGAVVPRRYAPRLRCEAPKHRAAALAHYQYAGAALFACAPATRQNSQGQPSICTTEHCAAIPIHPVDVLQECSSLPPTERSAESSALVRAVRAAK